MRSPSALTVGSEAIRTVAPAPSSRGLRSAQTRRATPSSSTDERCGSLESSWRRISPSTRPDIRSTDRRALLTSSATVGSADASVASSSSSRLALRAVSGMRRSWLTRAAISRSRLRGTAFASSSRSSRRCRSLVTLSPRVSTACSCTGVSCFSSRVSMTQTRPTIPLSGV